MSKYGVSDGWQSEQTLFAVYRDEIEQHRQTLSATIGVEVSFEWAAAEYLSQCVPAWRESQWTQLIHQELHENFFRLLDGDLEPLTRHRP
jgi:hypothetical protein